MLHGLRIPLKSRSKVELSASLAALRDIVFGEFDPAPVASGGSPAKLSYMFGGDGNTIAAVSASGGQARCPMLKGTAQKH
jgi:hypothetical protein